MAVAATSMVKSAQPWRRHLSYLQDALLVVLSGLFVYTHGHALLAEGRVSSLPFVIEQSILVVLFLVRRRSRHTSSRPADWVVAAVGTWGALAVRPWGEAPATVAVLGIAIQVVGVSMAAIAFLNLGRSVGVVAANRGLKTGGLYAFVRHPIYAAHTLTLTGFTLANPHPWNVGAACLVVVCLALRIRAEERLLSETDNYGMYCDRVRWRLCPWVW